jgi:predicted amidohydrolase
MNERELTVAAIQMSSTPNKDENLTTAEQLIHAAASSGADLVTLPELWNCHGLEKAYRENAEPIPGETTRFLGDLARERGIYLLGGSILERHLPSPKLHNTSTLFRPDGEMSAERGNPTTGRGSVVSVGRRAPGSATTTKRATE